jgi:hypothetical protein
MRDETRYHPARTTSQIGQFQMLGTVQVFLIAGDLNLGPNFAARTFGDL